MLSGGSGEIRSLRNTKFPLGLFLPEKNLFQWKRGFFSWLSYFPLPSASHKRYSHTQDIL